MGLPAPLSKRTSFPPVLVIGYKRPRNIQTILNICIESGISTVYLFVDGPKHGDLETINLQEEIRLISEIYQKAENLKLVTFFSRKNKGCAVSVLDAIDWAFKEVSELVVLEDDCIPSIGFFGFCEKSRSIFAQRNDVWLACGSQFVPATINHGSYVSKYALTWGWYTTKNKWTEIKKAFINLNTKIFWKSLFAIKPESNFWYAGARRALHGYTDVWDTVLLACMYENNKKSVLPHDSLVTNVGNDSVATHTQFDYSWTNQKLTSYKNDEIHAENSISDIWIQKHVFRIKLRHSISTKVSLIIDFFRKRKFQLNLLDRLGISEYE